MEINDILSAVEAEICKRYPGEPVYWDRLPKGFERPSFSLECTRSESVDVNIGLVRRQAAVLVTCFVEVDSYGDSSRAELNRRQDGVMAIFGAGHLAVGDRHITVSANKGEGAPDDAEVTAIFAWVDARPGDTGLEPDGAPVIEHYKLNVSNGKE